MQNTADRVSPVPIEVDRAEALEIAARRAAGSEELVCFTRLTVRAEVLQANFQNARRYTGSKSVEQRKQEVARARVEAQSFVDSLASLQSFPRSGAPIHVVDHVHKLVRAVNQLQDVLEEGN